MRVCDFSNGLSLKQSFAKVLLRVISKARSDDGAVKGYKARVFVNRKVKRCDVAEAQKDFRVATNQVVINAI